jgi:hypothetical protein
MSTNSVAGLLSNFGATFYLPQLVVVISLRKYTERLWEWLVLESLLRNHASNARRAEAYDGHLDEAERKNDGLASLGRAATKDEKKTIWPQRAQENETENILSM